MFGDWESVFALVAGLLIAYAVVLWIGAVVWTYRDIRERTRDGWSQTVAALLVVVFNMPGLILYLILRPHETLTEAYEHRLESEAVKREVMELNRSCPSCARPAKEEFLLCPYCRTKLHEPCGGCGRALELGWLVCPYCGAQGPQTALAPALRAAAGTPAPSGGQPVPTAQAPALAPQGSAGPAPAPAGKPAPPWPQTGPTP